MADFQQIVTGLKANYIIVIENDLHYEENVNVVLVKYCELSEFKRERLTTSLNNIGKIDSVELLEAFRKGYSQLVHNAELKAALLPDDLPEYLKAIQGEGLITEPLSENLKLICADPTVNELLLRNGIFTLGDNRYDILLNEFSQIPGVEITFYRSKPVPAEMEQFLGEIKHGLQNTGSAFYIAVIDKMLGEGQEESGKAFIEQDLIPLNKTNELKSLAFLFTSQANMTQPGTFGSYFIREVEKGGNDLITVIAGYLTDSAYATVFKSFNDDYLSSTENAFEIALRNQQNVKHVINKSISEGISPFDSLKAWFDQIVQYNIENRHIDSISYYSALTIHLKGFLLSTK